MQKVYKDWSLEIDDENDIYLFESPRGGAKSYSLMNFALNDFIENFNEFYWLRRKQTDIDNETSKLIPDKLLQKYNIVDFKCKKGSVFITFDGKNYARCGWYGAISVFKKGQRNFHNVKTIVFDEYNDTVDLLAQERFKFWNAIATIVDSRDDYKIFFLGNETIFYNPYEYLKGRPRVKTVEIKDIDTSYIGTPIYNAVVGTDVGSYMFESNYFKDFKFFYSEARFNKINKKVITTFNSIVFYYITDEDIVVLDYKENITNKITRDEFNNIEKEIADNYYNKDKLYYTNKETYKKVSEYLPNLIK